MYPAVRKLPYMPFALDWFPNNLSSEKILSNSPEQEQGLSPAEILRIQEELATVKMALQESERQFEQRVEERTRELSTLLRVSHNITTTLELEPLLGTILEQLRDVVEYQLASISILENENELVILAVRGEGMPSAGTRLSLNEHSNARHLLNNREPHFVPDLNADTPLAKQMREDLAAQNLKGMLSWMNAPLVVRDRSIGILALAHPEVNYYNPARVALAMVFANQAAAAIINARAYGQARRLASLEERQKLARELHDSVSQALYGISLGARTAQTQLERDPAKLAEPLDYILSLAEAGLSEMRALIFELRPESIQTEGLVAALTKQADAIHARHKINVVTDFGEEPNISLDAKEALYRIAQEALQNVAKHAHATKVELSLQNKDGKLILEIRDNGKGYDASREFPGHLGMKSMPERAAQIGGEFRIQSRAGTGTVITAIIPK